MTMAEDPAAYASLEPRFILYADLAKQYMQYFAIHPIRSCDGRDPFDNLIRMQGNLLITASELQGISAGQALLRSPGLVDAVLMPLVAAAHCLHQQYKAKQEQQQREQQKQKQQQEEEARRGQQGKNEGGQQEQQEVGRAGQQGEHEGRQQKQQQDAERGRQQDKHKGGQQQLQQQEAGRGGDKGEHEGRQQQQQHGRGRQLVEQQAASPGNGSSNNGGDPVDNTWSSSSSSSTGQNTSSSRSVTAEGGMPHELASIASGGSSSSSSTTTNTTCSSSSSTRSAKPGSNSSSSTTTTCTSSCSTRSRSAIPVGTSSSSSTSSNSCSTTTTTSNCSSRSSGRGALPIGTSSSSTTTTSTSSSSRGAMPVGSSSSSSTSTNSDRNIRRSTKPGGRSSSTFAAPVIFPDHEEVSIAGGNQAAAALASRFYTSGVRDGRTQEFYAKELKVPIRVLASCLQNGMETRVHECTGESAAAAAAVGGHSRLAEAERTLQQNVLHVPLVPVMQLLLELVALLAPWEELGDYRYEPLARLSTVAATAAMDDRVAFVVARGSLLLHVLWGLLDQATKGGEKSVPVPLAEWRVLLDNLTVDGEERPHTPSKLRGCWQFK